MNRKRRYAKEEFARRGNKIYQESVRSVVEDGNKERIVAIDIESEAYEAIVYTGLADKDRAFEWLDKGYDERPANMSYLKVEPRLDPLRSDPCYRELLQRMGLPR
jgi:hypothetical protein